MFEDVRFEFVFATKKDVCWLTTEGTGKSSIHNAIGIEDDVMNRTSIVISPLPNSSVLFENNKTLFWSKVTLLCSNQTIHKIEDER